MKYLVLFIIVIVSFLVALFNRSTVLQTAHRLYYYSLCDSPITYHIGSVDPRFGITENAFLNDTKQAVNSWNSASGKTALAYDPQGTLSVSLIYDQRQSLNTQITSLQDQLNTERQNMDPQLQEYKHLESDFKQKLDTLNNEIRSWNDKGGAPSDVYNQILKEQQDLRNEGARLDQLAQQLNQSTTVYNTQVNQLDKTVQNFNQALQVKPEEGLYDGRNKTISIYFNTNQEELLHTLMHEFGHALGLSHVSDPNAIMYPYTTKTSNLTSADLSQLQALCRERTLFEIIGEEIHLVLHNTQILVQRYSTI